ncbi:ABC transporter ATP-binding protein [Escherichia coli]|nr:ABC transporter ATP-binding protein [Escherichia coli]
MSVTHIPQVAIETRHLYKRFGDVTALDDINLRIAQGEFVAIMGASGSGKTTLMNILTCLDTATEGQVFLDGTDAAALDEEGRRRFRAEKIGLVFQQFHLIPFLTALENIMLAQHYHSVVDEAAARKVLEQVGLGHRVTHLPSQLSGGEQQRVLDLLTDLHRQGRTIVMVTHNPALGQFADRILRLQHGKYLGEEANQHALA